MSGDYKYEMQMIAEELAEREFGKNFYDLTEEQQFDTFRAAEERWAEDKANEADLLKDKAHMVDAIQRERQFSGM
jgi:hypothetical protein